jgi:hypothetical protein
MPSLFTLDDRRGGKNLIRLLALLLALAVTPMVALAQQWDIEEEQGGGHVLPPTVHPHGYSLERMASLLAFFTSTGNNQKFYPFPQFPDRSDPFQILDLDFTKPQPTPFKVYAGTMFYVPIFLLDDSPPIIDTFPKDSRDATDYFLNKARLGGHSWNIIVDGRQTDLGPEFFAGPVDTPPLADAPPCQGGTHAFLFGVFLTPLSIRGSPHTIIFSGVLDGTAVRDANSGNPFTETVTYSVTVVPPR